MTSYLIQEYNKEMTILVKQYDHFHDNDIEALAEAYEVAKKADIVVLWRRQIIDPTRLTKIAKFY